VTIINNEGNSVAGTIKWQSPSNIALVKYWGKHGNQLPRNPSISITLRESVTTTEIEYQLISKADGLSLDFYFEGKPAREFAERIGQFLNKQTRKYPWLNQVQLTIKSSNTFPHSSGIASSASAFSALALCLMSVAEILDDNKMTKSDFYRSASELARLGSGSASRSVYGGYVVWGAHGNYPKYSDHYAVPITTPIHKVFDNYHDAILIVSGEKKKVGSTAGHNLMEGHAFAKARYEQANNNLVSMHNVLETGDLEKFVEIVENEALSLHGLMMSSNPGYLLMKYNTIQMINIIRDFRASTKVPLCFTLDAGPNVHLLYPDQYNKEVIQLIHSELLPLCDNRRWIDDGLGSGPVRIINPY
jgi:diphosphomevalonate decarboxylase